MSVQRHTNPNTKHKFIPHKKTAQKTHRPSKIALMVVVWWRCRSKTHIFARSRCRGRPMCLPTGNEFAQKGKPP